MNMNEVTLLVPEWPAPPNVKSAITTRNDGVSCSPFDGFNLATHVGDDAVCVTANRRLLSATMEARMVSSKLKPITWLTQVHGTDILDLDAACEASSRAAAIQSCTSDKTSSADGAVARVPGNICAVLTADCLPVLMCDKQGTQVAAIHAGWQGMAKGVLSCAVSAFTCAPEDILCYFGPAISVKHFEVGSDVLAAFQQAAKQRPYKKPIEDAFYPSQTAAKKWFGDLYALARSELQGKGVYGIYGGTSCSYSEHEHFYSFRRDGVTGRMASLIWLA